jgi:hypothetical protein
MFHDYRLWYSFAVGRVDGPASGAGGEPRGTDRIRESLDPRAKR